MHMFVLSMVFLLLFNGVVAAENDIEVGVYYFPGWKSDSKNWRDLQGTSDSKSPGIAWPQRYPLLGFYPEEELWVAEKHISWASEHGITLFLYDWYWNGGSPELNHAISNYLKAGNHDRLKFGILWANHSSVPASLEQFKSMVRYWIDNYFKEVTFYRIEGSPSVFIFSVDQLETNARKFGYTSELLLALANDMAKDAGYRGIYFVALTNFRPSKDLDSKLHDYGYQGYSGWNYSDATIDKVSDYNTMVDTYLSFYREAAKVRGTVDYLVPASPGWDNRPWAGQKAVVRENSTPAKFGTMLRAARETAETTGTGPRIVLIEAWNEFGEGSYIEPTNQWGFQYLDQLKGVFQGEMASSPASTVR